MEDDLDENHYVVDFIALKDLTRAITDELDHRMLLPCASQQIQLHEDGPNVRVTYRDRYWSFPRDECVLVPVANTTAELLADYIAGRLRQAMTARGLKLPPDPAGRGRRELRPVGHGRMAPGRREACRVEPTARLSRPEGPAHAGRFDRRGTPSRPAPQRRRRL